MKIRIRKFYFFSCLLLCISFIGLLSFVEYIVLSSLITFLLLFFLVLFPVFVLTLLLILYYIKCYVYINEDGILKGSFFKKNKVFVSKNSIIKITTIYGYVRPDSAVYQVEPYKAVIQYKIGTEKKHLVISFMFINFDGCKKELIKNGYVLIENQL